MKLVKFILKYGKWFNVLCTIFIFANLYLALERGDGPWFMVIHGFFLGTSVACLFSSWVISWRRKNAYN